MDKRPPADARLLAALEAGIPLEPRPFAVIAARIDADEAWVIERTKALLADGTVRRLAVSFDSRALGLLPTLVAAETDPARREEAASLVNALDEATHNCRRCGSRFDMWFTLIASSRRRIDEILQRLRDSGAFREIVELPAARSYKADARLSALAREGGYV